MLIDSHCHLNRLDLSRHNGKLENALNAAREQGVVHILSVCVNIEEFPEILKIAQENSDVSCSVGVQPSEKNVHEPTVEELADLAKHPKVAAIGEAGLDYYYGKGEEAFQRERLRRHIHAAKIVKKPLIIHSRSAHSDILKILKEEKAEEIGGVMHCFTDNWEAAQQILSLNNFYISFSGIVTFKKAEVVQEVAKKIPLDRMLIETDSPYLAPAPMRGKSNEPAYIRYIAEFIAKLRNLNCEEIAQKTSENFYRLFGK